MNAPPTNEIGRGGTNPATDGLPNNTSAKSTASQHPVQSAGAAGLAKWAALYGAAVPEATR